MEGSVVLKNGHVIGSRLATALLAMNLVSAAPTGAASNDAGSDDWASNPAANTRTMVYPTITTLPDGATQVVYVFPNGQTSTSVTPPKGFDPLSASDAQLSEFDFPTRPDDPADLQMWTDAMSAFRSDDPPTGPVEYLPLGQGTVYSSYGYRWGGWVAGTWQEQSHHYIAIKGNFRVPNDATCNTSNVTAFWIGLGGTANSNPSLVQQGMSCGDSTLGGGSKYRPWYEFADEGVAKHFCSQPTTWQLNAGDVIYQNMSFQTSSNTGYFYFEDQTTGKAASCHDTPPSGWSWNLNTAEWIGEAPANQAANFNSIGFYNTRAELYSNSTWVTLGSQSPRLAVVDGQSSTVKCIYPGNIGADLTSFTDYWHSGSCFF